MHVPHFNVPILYSNPFVVTIHDLIKHYSRGLANTTRHPAVYWFKYLEYLILVRLAILRASHIIVPANYWKEILIKINKYLYSDVLTKIHRA